MPRLAGAGVRVVGTWLLLAMLVGGCAARAEASPTPSLSRGHAEARVGPFLLVFEMPSTIWTTTDVIAGRAELRYLGTGTTTIGASGEGPLAFDVSEVNGDRHVESAMTLDCMDTQLSSSAPLTSALTRGGALDTSFARSFLTAKDYQLPAGDWDITAWAMFNDQAGCAGGSQNLRATIRIHVAPAA